MSNRSLLLVTLLAVPCSTPSAPAQEQALLRDGRRLDGALRLDAGKLLFEPRAANVSTPLEAIASIRFRGSTPVFRLAAARRVHLPDGQHLSGEVLAMADNLTLRTGWADPLRLPRSAISVGPLPGWRTRFVDFFDAGLEAWTVRGEPAVESRSGALYSHAVLLGGSEQQLTHMLDQPIAEGRVSVGFQEQDKPAGATWLLEAVFGDRSARTIGITVAGPGDHYSVQAEGLSGTAQPVKRSQGLHRLQVSFSAQALHVRCDNDVLWYNLERGPGGPLQQVRLSCRTGREGEAGRGTVAWSAFCLEQAVNEPPRPPTDPVQDEVWLDTGDQLFGRILRADRRRLSLQGRFGRRDLPWARIQGCSFRREKVEQLPGNGPHVRLRLHSLPGPAADVLEGHLRQLDERRLILQHPLLKEVVLPRAWLQELEPLDTEPTDARNR